MKSLVLSAILALGFSASAKTFTLKNQEAQRLVEALANDGYTFAAVDATTKKESVQGPIQCRYSANADELFVDVHCYIGFSGTGPTGLEMPPIGTLALLQTIEPYARKQMVIGFYGYAVDQIDCIQKTSSGTSGGSVHKYICTLTVN